MFRKITTAALLMTVMTSGFATAAEARHRRYDDRGYHGRVYDRGYSRHANYSRRCHDKGNGGLAIGAIAGGLLGNTVAGHGDKTLGTVLGAAGGGLLGRSVDRSDGRRC